MNSMTWLLGPTSPIDKPGGENSALSGMPKVMIARLPGRWIEFDGAVQFHARQFIDLVGDPSDMDTDLLRGP